MTEKAKNVNYTEAQAKELADAYSDCDSDETRAECVENFSQKFGKNVKSIRAKLVREGVYVKKAYVSKTGKKAETKDRIVEAIAGAMGVSSERLNGLEKATKPTLELIRATVEIAAQDAQEE